MKKKTSKPRTAKVKEPAHDFLVDMFSCSDNPEDPTFSSTIGSASYDLQTKILIVAFRKKEDRVMYIYDGSEISWANIPKKAPGFPMDVWEKFKAAGSKGSFFQAVIAKRFKGVKYE